MGSNDEDQVRELLSEVLSFPTPQAEPDEVRRFIAEVVRPKLPADCFDEIRIDPAGNLLARRHGPAGERPLLFYTYAATYPAEGMVDPYPARVVEEGGETFLRGRGAAEQRPGLAAALVGLTAFLQSSPKLRRGLDFVTCVAGEMGNHLVARELVATHDLLPSNVVIAVSSNNELCLGNLGRVDVHVSVHGKPTHSSDPSNGINAIDGARIFLNRLAELAVNRVDPDLGPATIAATSLQTSPRASHTIPGLAELTLDCRLIPGDDVAAVMAGIEACATDLGACRGEVRAGHVNLPNKVSPESALARSARQALQEAGLPGRIVYKRSALDAGYFSSIGAESIVVGPGDPKLAHSNEERVRLADVVAATAAYRRLAALLCGAGG